MSANDPSRTVPRTPDAAQLPADGSKSLGEAEQLPNLDHTTDHLPLAETPASAGTVARTPQDFVRLEEQAKTLAAEDVPGHVLLRELGRGGMGVVYEARHIKLNRVVALKMALGGRTDEKTLIRFLAEAEAVAAVRHENVVQVYDYGESDGRPFMSLEYCPGGTLNKLLPKDRDAAHTPREMAALVVLVARGVAAAHAQGIVHRDLKPGNVFLDETGVPKVADFGLAKRGEGADVTREGVGMGTPSYMSPEQSQNAKFVGPQADVWALGVILYEALTGTRPFAGSVQEILAKAQNTEPLAPRKVVRTVPRDLELICLKCLAKQPHERYPTAKELADDLDCYLRGVPVSVRPAGPLERGYKWAKRNKVMAAALTACFLAVVLGSTTAGAVWLWRNALAERETAWQDKLDAEQKKLDAERQALEAIRTKEDAVGRAVARVNLNHIGQAAHNSPPRNLQPFASGVPVHLLPMLGLHDFSESATGAPVGMFRTPSKPRADVPPLMKMFLCPSDPDTRVPAATVTDGASNTLLMGERYLTTISSPRLGITARPVGREVADFLSFDPDVGIIVDEVTPGSPAQKAGVQKRDLLFELDGVVITSRASAPPAIENWNPLLGHGGNLHAVVENIEAGKGVRAYVFRKGLVVEIQGVVFEEKPTAQK